MNAFEPLMHVLRIAVGLRCRAQRAGVRARARLGQAIRRDLLHRRELAAAIGALLVVAEASRSSTTHMLWMERNAAVDDAAAREFLEDQRRIVPRQPRAAMLFAAHRCRQSQARAAPAARRGRAPPLPSAPRWGGACSCANERAVSTISAWSSVSWAAIVPSLARLIAPRLRAPAFPRRNRPCG